MIRLIRSRCNFFYFGKGKILPGMGFPRVVLFLTSAIIITIVLANGGCTLFPDKPVKPYVAPVQPIVDEPLAPRLYRHTIRWRGETLIAISTWYTGSQENWETILESNPGLDPRKLTIGSAVFIPVNLMARKRAMPQDFLRKIVAKKRKIKIKISEPRKTPPQPRASDDSVDIELFGPIE